MRPRKNIQIIGGTEWQRADIADLFRYRTDFRESQVDPHAVIEIGDVITITSNVNNAPAVSGGLKDALFHQCILDHLKQMTRVRKGPKSLSSRALAAIEHKGEM